MGNMYFVSIKLKEINNKNKNWKNLKVLEILIMNLTLISLFLYNFYRGLKSKSFNNLFKNKFKSFRKQNI